MRASKAGHGPLRGRRHPRAAKRPTPLDHCHRGPQSFLDPPHTTQGLKGPVPYSFTPAPGLWLERSLRKAQVPTTRDHPLLHGDLSRRAPPANQQADPHASAREHLLPLTHGLGHMHRGTPGPSQQGTPLGPFPSGGDNSRESSLALWTADIHLFQREKMNVNTVIYQQL